MKKAAISFGYEIAGNSDRKVSLGLNYNRKNLSGDYTEVTDVSAFSLDNSVGYLADDVTIDGRFPINDSFTLSGGIGFSSLELRLRDTTVNSTVTREINVPTSHKLSGYNLNLGLRYYDAAHRNSPTPTQINPATR